MVKLTANEQAYLAQAEALYRDFQLPPSAGRVLGYLLICQPAQQSEPAIQEALGLSVGSANAAVRLLTRSGLVERVTTPGTRKLHYEIKPGIWRRLFERRLQAGRRAHELARAGLQLAPRNARLKEMHQFYASLEQRMEALFEENP